MATTKALTTEKLTGTVGAEVLDVDLERIRNDEDLPHAVMDALEEHGVLVFRGLQIDDEAQVGRYLASLGEVVPFPGDIPEILVIAVDPREGPAFGIAEGERWLAYRWDPRRENPAEAFDAEREGAVGGGRRYRVCEHLCGVRRPHRGGEGAACDPGSALLAWSEGNG